MVTLLIFYSSLLWRFFNLVSHIHSKLWLSLVFLQIPCSSSPSTSLHWIGGVDSVRGGNRNGHWIASKWSLQSTLQQKKWTAILWLLETASWGALQGRVQRYELCMRPPLYQGKCRPSCRINQQQIEKKSMLFRKKNFYSSSVPTLKQCSSKVLHMLTKKTVVWLFIAVLWSCQHGMVWLRAGVSPLQLPAYTDLS